MAPKSPPPTPTARNRDRSHNRSKPHHTSHHSHRRHASNARMPFALKVRYALFFALLLVLVVIYVTTGPASTRNSEFYKRTVALMEYRAGKGPAPDDNGQIPERPIHRAGGLHFAEGDHHLTPQERLAMEAGKLKGEPPVGPDGQPIGLDGEQIRGETEEIGPVDQSHQRGQRPLIDTDAKLRERLNKAEREAKKSADEKYRALKDIEAEVRKEREMRGQDPNAPLAGKADKKGGKHDDEDHDHDEVIERSKNKGKDKSVAGRKKVPAEPAEPLEKESAAKSEAKEKALKDEEDDDKAPYAAPSSTSVAETKKKTPEEKQKEKEEDEQSHHLRTVLAEILAKSPVTIFSKTYCPFSMKAKRILLDAYSIRPAPFVVELNEHPEGVALQQLLQKTTGRRTVPNVLVNGKSIGGGDECELLWKNGELPARIQQMAGKRVESVVNNYGYGQSPPQQPKMVEGALKA